MDDPDDAEVFWVERPADLLELPTPHRSDVAVYNDATKLVIIAAIVLAVLKVRAWIVVLTVGLLVIVVAYYNKHPTSARRRVVAATVAECKEVLREYNTGDKPLHVEPFVRMDRRETKLDAPREMRIPVTSSSTTSSSTRSSATVNVGDGYSSDGEFSEKEWRKTVTFVDDYVTSDKKKRTNTSKFNTASVDNVRNEQFQHLEAYYETLEDDREQLQHELDAQDTFENRFRYH